jgi:hypothetical protein
VTEPQNTSIPQPKRLTRLRIAGALLTLFGVALFGGLIYSIGVNEIVEGIGRFGFLGFAVILSIYFVRIFTRSLAWKLSVYSPYRLGLNDTVPAVIIGEAMSSTVPLGILISGTSKAVAVRKKIPLVAALSSVATENLFYSLVTGIYLIAGAVLMLRVSAVDNSVAWTLNALIAALVILLVLGVTMVIRQWHFASELCEKIYQRGYLKKFLENGRLHVRLFENLIYDFYRRHPRRFVPICLLEASFHLLGILEVYYILERLVDTNSNLKTAFLLESVSRLLTVLFKFIPFNIGVDEAGAQFVGEAIALAAGVGVTLAIIRKGRILFWTAVGWVLIAKRGLSFADLSRAAEDAPLNK